MGKVRKYKVYLNSEQRARLERLVKNGHGASKKLLHARILLMADAEHPAGRWRDEQIARALGTHRNTVARIRRRFVQEGETPALERRPRPAPAVAPKFDGAAEAQLVALCCSAPPEGHARWSLRLLVRELKAREILTEVERECVRKTLKKINCNLGASSATASPSATAPASSRRWRTSSTSTPPRPTPKRR